MTLPNFFIVGAAKSGTTSLYRYLQQHPQIFMPELKEPSFFIDWERGVQTQQDYEALFSTASGYKAIGEASTAYLFNSATPERIRTLIPNARIIIMLRNPVEMAYALWRMNRQNDSTGEKFSFSVALQKETQRMLDSEFPGRCGPWWHQNYYYFHRGLYHDQVKRYLDLFGRSKTKIFPFEEFKEDPLKICQELFLFLDVDPEFIPVMKIHNANIPVRHSGLHKLLTKSSWGQRMDSISNKGRVPYFWLWEFLMKLNLKKPPPLGEQLRKELITKFRPDIEKLEGLIGRDLSLWS